MTVIDQCVCTGAFKYSLSSRSKVWSDSWIIDCMQDFSLKYCDVCVCVRPTISINQFFGYQPATDQGTIFQLLLVRFWPFFVLCLFFIASSYCLSILVNFIIFLPSAAFGFYLQYKPLSSPVHSTCMLNQVFCFDSARSLYIASIIHTSM